MRALVVPTIRETSIKDFLESWQSVDDWDVIIVVEDNPEKSFDIEVDYHFCWKDIDGDLRDDSWIISRRDSAIRSYGFYKAYQLGAEYIFTLDDDCFPIVGSNFCEEHLDNLENTTKWCDSVLGYRTRGLPYKNFGNLSNVKLSMGLWEGVPDLDAVNTLVNYQELKLSDTRVMPVGQYFPICGMNLAFKSEITPLTYFPLMGEGYLFKRFDDIWFGIMCKKICDHLGFSITCGKPYIHHSRASDVFDNLIKEAPGIKYNEKFWEIIDNMNLKSDSISDCMKEIGISLEQKDDEYLKKLGRAIQIWTGLFPS